MDVVLSIKYWYRVAGCPSAWQLRRRDGTTNMNCARGGYDRRLTLIVIIFANLASAFHGNNGILEYWNPNTCKYDEYFDTVSLSCLRCNASRNLASTADRRCMVWFYPLAVCDLFRLFYYPRVCVSRRSAMPVRRVKRNDRFRERQSTLRRVRSQHDRDRWRKGLRPALERAVQMLLEPNKT